MWNNNKSRPSFLARPLHSDVLWAAVEANFTIIATLSHAKWHPTMCIEPPLLSWTQMCLAHCIYSFSDSWRAQAFLIIHPAAVVAGAGRQPETEFQFAGKIWVHLGAAAESIALLPRGMQKFQEFRKILSWLRRIKRLAARYAVVTLLITVSAHKHLKWTASWTKRKSDLSRPIISKVEQKILFYWSPHLSRAYYYLLDN